MFHCESALKTFHIVQTYYWYCIICWIKNFKEYFINEGIKNKMMNMFNQSEYFLIQVIDRQPPAHHLTK